MTRPIEEKTVLPKKQLLYKFALLCLLLASYFVYLSIQYDLVTGGVAAILTWSVIVFSAAGTFLSIRFADEIMDVIHHRDREFFHSKSFIHEIIIIMFFVLIFIGYYELIASLGID